MDFFRNVGFLNWGAGWGAALFFTLGVCWGIISASTAIGGRKLRKPNIRQWRQFLWEPVSASYQQLILFAFLALFKYEFPEFLWWNEVAVCVFGMMHWPNLFYMFPAGCMMFPMIHFMEVYHNIYATIASHTIIGAVYLRCPPRYISTFSKPFGRYIEKQKRFSRMIKGLINDKANKRNIQ